MAISPAYPEAQSVGDLANGWSNPYYPTYENLYYDGTWAGTHVDTTFYFYFWVSN